MVFYLFLRKLPLIKVHKRKMNTLVRFLAVKRQVHFIILESHELIFAGKNSI